MKKLILVAGKARNGKDSFTDFLINNLDSARRVDITGYLKRGVADMLGVSVAWLEENKDKSCVEIGLDRKKDGVHSVKITPRRILQKQADICRQYITCEKALEELFMEDRQYYFLTGVRLPSEVDLIRRTHADKKVIVVKIEREGYNNTSPDKLHKTETLVDLIEPDYVYISSSMDELRVCAEDFLKNIK